jgi:PKD repeat protein
VNNIYVPDTVSTRLATVWKPGQEADDACVPPVANFSVQLTTVAVDTEVQFTDTSTGNPMTAWAWDFGDGTTSSEQNPIHIYEVAGTYTVTLAATNECGVDFEIKIDYITVGAGVAPVAAFTQSVDSGDVPFSVAFTNLSTGTPTLTYVWDFGDGSATSTQTNPTHLYTEPGTYTVTLTVTNAAGTDDATDTVTAEDLVIWNTATETPSSGFVFTDSNRTAQHPPTNTGVFSVNGHSTGKRYFEVLWTYTGAYGAAIRHDLGICGLAAPAGLSDLRGATSVCYNRTGTVYKNGVNTFAADNVVSGDVIMFAVDFDTGDVWVGKNGIWANSGDPGTGVNPVVTGISAGTYKIAGCYEAAGANYHTHTINGTTSQMTETIPTGFSAWGSV